MGSKAQLEKEETQQYRKKYFNRGGKSEFIDNDIDRKHVKGKENTIADTNKDLNIQNSGVKSTRTKPKNDPDEEITHSLKKWLRELNLPITYNIAKNPNNWRRIWLTDTAFLRYSHYIFHENCTLTHFPSEVAIKISMTIGSS